MEDLADFAAQLIQSRRTTLPKRLVEPGPTPDQQQRLFEAAAAAPDHDQILPWHFTVVAPSARERLGAAFVAALLGRYPQATPEQQESAREKASRSPWLVLLTVDLSESLGCVPAAERYLSAGCAVQNLMLQAQAMGLASSLTSGLSMNALALRQLFGLTPQEQAVCFVSVGSISSLRAGKPRPSPQRFLRTLA